MSRLQRHSHSCYQVMTLHDVMEKKWARESKSWGRGESLWDWKCGKLHPTVLPACFPIDNCLFMHSAPERRNFSTKWKSLSWMKGGLLKAFPIPLLLSTSGGLRLTRRCHLIPKHEVKLQECQHGTRLSSLTFLHTTSFFTCLSRSFSYSPFSLVTRRHERSRQGKINLLPPSSSCSSSHTPPLESKSNS